MLLRRSSRQGLGYGQSRCRVGAPRVSLRSASPKPEAHGLLPSGWANPLRAGLFQDAQACFAAAAWEKPHSDCDLVHNPAAGEKLQAPNTRKSSSTNSQCYQPFVLELGSWRFFGVWSLVFGVFYSVFRDRHCQNFACLIPDLVKDSVACFWAPARHSRRFAI